MSQNNDSSTKEPEETKEESSSPQPTEAKSGEPKQTGSEPLSTQQAESSSQNQSSESKKTTSGPVKSDQEPVEPVRSSPRPSEAGSDQTTPETPSQEKKDSVKMTESVRRLAIWTMTSFFDWNPKYFIQLRGMLNIAHLVLSLVVMIMLGIACQLHSYPSGPSEGFYCRPPETYLFIMSCASFFTAILYLFCCMLSKRTDVLLYETSFEVSYFILYFILIVTASIALIISSISWGSDRAKKDDHYDSTLVAAIIGLVNSILYGFNAIWFFISHRYYQVSMMNLPKQETAQP